MKASTRFGDFLTGNRILLQRIAIVVVFAFAYALPPGLPGKLAEAGEMVGFVLLCCAALGRVWCLMFIGGVKNATLITHGPYSVVRNPLYLLNLAGAFGFGIAIEQPVLAVLVLCVLALYHSAVVRREEQALSQIFGDAYRAYLERTPRWIPRFSQYVEPDLISVNPYWIRRGLLDSMWWLWAFLIWELLEQFHAVA